MLDADLPVWKSWTTGTLLDGDDLTVEVRLPPRNCTPHHHGGFWPPSTVRCASWRPTRRAGPARLHMLLRPPFSERRVRTKGEEWQQIGFNPYIQKLDDTTESIYVDTSVQPVIRPDEARGRPSHEGPPVFTPAIATWHLSDFTANRGK